MGRLFLAVFGFLAVANLGWAADPASEAGGDAAKPAAKASGDAPRISADLQTDKQKGSYAIGYRLGHSLPPQFKDGSIDLAAFLLGIQESFSNGKASLSAPARQAAMQTFAAQLEEARTKKMKSAAAGNKKKGDAYRAANAKKKGVKTLESGVQYEVLKEGAGKQPKSTDRVEVHYHGMLINGTVFDSSVDRGQPYQCSLGEVIRGWTEVVQMMKEGSKWRVVIPPALAYGAEGRQPIGPNETLVFEIELLRVL